MIASLYIGMVQDGYVLFMLLRLRHTTSLSTTMDDENLRD